MWVPNTLQPTTNLIEFSHNIYRYIYSLKWNKYTRDNTSQYLDTYLTILQPQLTHPPLVPHIYVNEMSQHWARYWLVACLATSHYPIVNWTHMNKLQWNSNRNTKLFIDENVFENVVCQIGDHFVQGGDELRLRLCSSLHSTRLRIQTRHWPRLPLCDGYQVSNIRRTKSQYLKDSRTVLRLSLSNPVKSDVKSRMKM